VMRWIVVGEKHVICGSRVFVGDMNTLMLAHCGGGVAFIQSRYTLARLLNKVSGTI